MDRIHKLLEMLDNPQKKVKAIHVAGTNGKGSTIQYIKNALLFNNYRAGVFTSPSLDGLNGYIFIDNNTITETDILRYMNEISPCIQLLDDENNHPTEFEIITAIAFMYFAENVDIALIEAGMGGKQDTTNCFLPILSIITNVERDHIAFLGDTFESIAHHKAGIIKANRPAIIGEMSETARAVISHEASMKNAPLYELNKTFNYSVVSDKHQTFVCTASGTGKNLKISIQANGSHQIKNASIAMMALELLQGNGFILSLEKIQQGLFHTQIPGRFEVIHKNPDIILDGAHNPAGIKAFVETVETNYKDMEKHLIFAAFKDKDLKRMLNQLDNTFSSITLTTFDHPRAASSEELHKLTNHQNTNVIDDWEHAVKVISCQNKDVCYFITGSLNFIAKVRKYFETSYKV
ncbi:bifunctional folylpolyglutamate synthase/dihydrofolate synthase [Virgibacillus doumboii]|uniref:bifunctional folylpolyglutamate synthase/dihydrofolate synthase n=1 Tax=Virgibacillus doumboii TaxID=2697503 RepID=UPI001FE5B553|nr:folylpolyglutamate synthase/dihydrofolate synthase family protein [Virgibacillus doumboii]